MSNNENLNTPSSDVNVINNFVVLLMKKCKTFFSHDNVQLEKKLYDLNILCSLWKKKADEDYSADVYATAVEMFAANVFRALPPSSYHPAADDELTAAIVSGFGGSVPGGGPAAAAAAVAAASTADESEAAVIAAAAEYAQTAMAYQAFHAFLDRKLFDADKMAPHVDRRFVGSLVHRLNSGDADERLTARDTLARIRDACPSAGGHTLNAVVAELADLAYGYVPRHNGVNDMLEFVADTVVFAPRVAHPAAVEKLSKVLIRLLKHQLLFSFKSKLIECVKALDNLQKDLIPQMLIFITKLWPCHNLKTIPLLCTVVELYDWCDKNTRISLQLRIVGKLSKLFCNDDFQLADESMNFWNQILHENIKLWQNRQNDVKIVVNALEKVKQTHWNVDCIKMANTLLKIMEAKNIIKKNVSVEDAKEVFQESKSSEINNDSNNCMPTNTPVPLELSLTYLSFKDTPAGTKSTTTP